MHDFLDDMQMNRLGSLQIRLRVTGPVATIGPCEHHVMADDCSRLWHLSDTQLLTHFALHYPQTKPWRLC